MRKRKKRKGKSKKNARELRESRRRKKLVKELEETLGARHYFSEPVRWGKRVPPMLVIGPRSNLSKPKARSSPLLDRAILQQLTRKLQYGGVFALSAKPPRPVRHRDRDKLHKFKRFKVAITFARHARERLSRLTDLAGDPMTNGWAASVLNWTHVTDVIKAAAYGAAIPDHSRYAFNLNLSPEIQDKALRSPRGFAKFMQDRIGRELRKAFPGRPVGFVFVVEGAYDIQGVEELIPFHIHGAIEVPDVQLDGERVELMSHEDDVAEALKKAGGKFPEEEGARQAKMEPIYNLIGWFAYLAKARFVTTHALNSARKMARIPMPASEGVLAATAALRSAGHRWFNDAKTNETQFSVATMKRRRGL